MFALFVLMLFVPLRLPLVEVVVDVGVHVASDVPLVRIDVVGTVAVVPHCMRCQLPSHADLHGVGGIVAQPPVDWELRHSDTC